MRSTWVRQRPHSVGWVVAAHVTHAYMCPHGTVVVPTARAMHRLHTRLGGEPSGASGSARVGRGG